MRRPFLLLFFLLLTVAVFSLSVSADTTAVSLDRALISQDGSVVTVTASLSEEIAARYDRVYLFRVTPNSASIDRLTPVADAAATAGQVVFTLPYDSSDHTTPLYGYVLGCDNGNGTYVPLSEPIYLENFAEYAHNTTPYPAVSSKKGLMVQYIADAQLLGVRHSVVPAYFNDLISEDEATSEAFVFGGIKYYIDIEALTELDYRIKSLSDAGIHVYLNFLLTFDTNAPDELYYPKVEGYAGKLYAPNLSTPDGVRCFAAVMHFLAERYSMPESDHGFCGSYILGYEVNQEADRNEAAISDFKNYVAAYATYLRTADIAIRSAYQNANLFVSLSNRWSLTEDSDPQVFGAASFLDTLIALCGDIRFGIAVNPYPSSLAMTDYWNDEKATDSPDTEYLTMKNLSVLTDYLKTEPLLYRGEPRSVVIAEFGVSGKAGEESEQLQAAAYAYAYYTACNNDLVEAFLWHRHVDHASEVDLYYGLYASSDLLLDPAKEKLIHRILSAVDTNGEEARQEVEALLSLLPLSDPTELYGGDAPDSNRLLFEVEGTSQSLSDTFWKKESLFDFSKSLYHFYPTDNAAYLDQVTVGGQTYLRAALISLSEFEYMGIGVPIDDPSALKNAHYVSLRLRVEATAELADIRLILNGSEEGKQVSLHATDTIICGEWTTVIFPLAKLSPEDLKDVTMKLWVRTDVTKGDTVYLDVSAVAFYTEKNIVPLVIFLVILGLALLGALAVSVYIAIQRVKRSVRRS